MPFIDDRVRLKIEGPEKGQLTEADLTLHESQYQRLVVELEESYNRATLPEVPSSRAALNDLLIRVRLVSVE